MVCSFCNDEAVVCLNIDEKHDLKLCRAHFEKVRNLCNGFAKTADISLWIKHLPLNDCTHEWEMYTGISVCRKCGEMYFPKWLTVTI